ncbi:MAG: NTPase [Bacteroidales bacterium]|nr:NTPase [Bacteroidales bacterium]
MNNILLQGEPGVGKTTLLCNLASSISYLKIGGFYTRELREEGKRVGFRIDTYDNQSGILSHVKYTSGPRVGKYRVDVTAFEEIGVQALVKALEKADVILIDEIGKMELYSEKFKEVVLRCLDSPKPLVATVMSRSYPFVDQIKVRQDVELMRVTFENRNSIADQLIRKITAF